MHDNPIVDEVHRTREKLLAQFGGDLHALIEDARRKTEEAARAGAKLYTPPSRKSAQFTVSQNQK